VICAAVRGNKRFVLQVPFESCAGAMNRVLRDLGASAVSAAGVSVTGEDINDNCLTVAAAASKAIMSASSH
jgi:hypothetical protein